MHHTKTYQVKQSNSENELYLFCEKKSWGSYKLWWRVYKTLMYELFNEWVLIQFYFMIYKREL